MDFLHKICVRVLPGLWWTAEDLVLIPGAPNLDFKFFTKRAIYTCSTSATFMHGLHYFNYSGTPTTGKVYHSSFWGTPSKVFSRSTNAIYTGFELAIRELWFVDWICLFMDHFKQFLWNSRIRTFFLLEFLSSGKPQSFCLHFKLHKLLISYSKKC